MRIDSRMSAVPGLTRRQRYFAECWYNLVHEASLDAFRVRTMNPCNAIRELNRVCVSGASESHRSQVAAEARHIFDTDPVFKHVPEFMSRTKDLVDLLEKIPGKLDESSGRTTLTWRLVDTFCRELQPLLTSRYVNDSVSLLRRWMGQPDGISLDADAEALRAIGTTLGALISVLVDTGWTLETLFWLHQRYIGRWQTTSDEQPYNFDDGLQRLLRRIESEPRDFTVTYIMTNVSRPDEFPATIADIRFSTSAPAILPEAKANARRFATEGGGKVFASINVMAPEARMAGAAARDRIARVLDVVRYNYERRQIALSEKFLIVTHARPVHGLVDLSGASIPNPQASINSQQFARFVGQVQSLAEHANAEPDAQDRIFSAFRLYRLGNDTTNLENKLVNWWTALEYLTNDIDSTNIGVTVENSLAPVVTLEYLPKHLHALRLALIDLNVELTDPDSETAIVLADMTLVDLYEFLKKPTVATAVLAACTDRPYIWAATKELLDALSNPQRLAKKLEGHANRLKWHIRRIYQARNDIVHSARRIGSARLLCANLEVYLHAALDGFLHELQLQTTLRNASEYFDRRAHLLSKILKQLKGGDEEQLLVWLAHFARAARAPEGE
ncbi:hypothetical protein KPB05_38015 [Burkholderia gladioli]|uniref:hypothetical protein n=1 Tax=Burkholderia gladioli TaxID=28095 RepID=UPI00285FD32F|nr:hypothetical protein [Burkholderia gladioli]MDR8093258.1 hypothetical protein [Burkholderia gladioli]